ncbi:hypothetical protein CBS101457_006612 [Exobasidium rhododendri]|nr:hypothetical protein CBS101457_006612 [Exobasidium rhododendri]
MLSVACRHSRPRIGWRSLYQPYVLTGQSPCSETLQQARHQSTSADNYDIISAEASTSSVKAEAVNGRKIDSAKANSWQLRKRLRKLSVSVGQSSTPKNQNQAEAKTSSWKHPSRAKADVDDLKRRARERWSAQAGEAARAAAVVAERERLRKNTSTTRAEKNANRLQRIEEAKGKPMQAIVSATSAFTPRSNSEPYSDNPNQKGVNIGQNATNEGLSTGGRLGESMAEDWDAILESMTSRLAEPEVQEEEQEHEQEVSRDMPPHSSIPQRQQDPADESTSVRSSRSGNWQEHTMRGQGYRGSEASRTELIAGASIDRHRNVIPSPDVQNIKNVSRHKYLPAEHLATLPDSKKQWWDTVGKWNVAVGGILRADDVEVKEVEPLREMEVAQLAHGLDRVLFNPGIHWLRDVRTGIYNFEPKLRDIYDVDLFDYSALPPYRTSSKDPELAELVRRLSKKYSGSTSSMTALLSHIYFLISAWKQPDLTGFSSGFATLPKTYSFGAKLPASIVLQRFEEEYEGKKLVRYAIDADKGEDGDNNNYVLMQLGKSVEKLLTSSTEEYEKYLRVNSHVLSAEAKEKPEAYYYASSGKFLMRSQLDCTDERLPRQSFDLKTRSVISVRQDRANWVESSGYKIRHATGVFESFEREMWDMTRATMLKYFFQARIGNMDGILVAYHSTATMFGFQYLPCEEMARRLFSSVEMGEQAFRLSIGLLERILDTLTDIKPERSLRITLDTEPGENPKMLAFAKYVDEAGVDTKEEAAQEQEEEEVLRADESEHALDTKDTAEESLGEEKESIEREKALRDRSLLQLDVQVDRYLGDELVLGPVDFNTPSGYRINNAMEDEITRRKRSSLPPLHWSIEYRITPRGDLNIHDTQENLRKIIARGEGLSPLILPNMQALNEREKMRERELSKNESALQKYYEDRKNGVALGMPSAPGQLKVGESSLGGTDTASKSSAAESEKVKEEKEGKEPVQRWKKNTVGVERLRELSRIGQQDKLEEAVNDRMILYERRGD